MASKSLAMLQHSTRLMLATANDGKTITFYEVELAADRAL